MIKFHSWIVANPGRCYVLDERTSSSEFREAIHHWKCTPWWGEFKDGAWIPRRYDYELLLVGTGQTLENNPSDWEEWFKAHRHLVWDEKLKRLVDQPKPLLSSPQ